MENKIESTELLKRAPLFSSLGFPYVQQLSYKLKIRSYNQGETIFHKGDSGSTLYIIKSGKVTITTSSSQGEEVILAILTQGDFFGELSLLDEGPRSANAIAVETTTVLCLERTDLIDIIHEEPDVAVELLSTLSKRVRHTNILLEDAIFLDLPSRLAKRLLELGEHHGVMTKKGLEIDLKLTQQDLLKTMSSIEEQIENLLHLFEHKGFISIDKRRICILRPDEFARLIH